MGDGTGRDRHQHDRVEPVSGMSGALPSRAGLELIVDGDYALQALIVDRIGLVDGYNIAVTTPVPEAQAVVQ